MQAIEFESVVQDRVIPLPQPQKLSSGQSVRVVVMYEDCAEPSVPKGDAISLLGSDSADRLAALVPHPDALGSPADDLASPWDEAAWRDKWGRS